MPLMRGALPSPRHILSAAVPHTVTIQAPPQFIYIPNQLSMWGNDTYGDCVTAEEAFAKACYTAGTPSDPRPKLSPPYAAGKYSAPEIFITDAEVLQWATANNFLNGANLTDVLNTMNSNGFVQNSTTYNDGSYTSVDWTNATVLQNAIYNGPVKIGVAADQLQNVVDAMPTLGNGWFATGFTKDTNEDHCVSLCGYGTIDWLATQLNVPVPSGVDGTAQGYGLFTWSTIGIIDAPSMINITGEAWLRNPTTVIPPVSKHGLK